MSDTVQQDEQPGSEAHLEEQFQAAAGVQDYDDDPTEPLPDPATLTAGARLPRFIGLGAAKTATTFLAECLREHPGVHIPLVKEPHYFTFSWKLIDLPTYAEYFREAPEGSAIGEFSVSYLTHPSAPRRLTGVLPDAKLIASVRNPVDMIWSWYWQGKRQNFWQVEVNDIELGFEEAIDKYPVQMQRSVEMATGLRRWLDLVPRDRLMVFVQEDIKADSPGQVRRLYEFIGVDPDYTPSALDANAKNKPVHGGVSPKGKLAGKAYGTLYSTVVGGFINPMRKILGPRFTKEFMAKLRIRDVARAAFFKRGYPKMTPEQHVWTAKRFEAEIAGLEEILGRDFSHWRQPKKA